MIEGLIVGLVALMALAYVSGPLRRGRDRIEDEPEQIAEADAEKKAKLGALIDLEDERLSGKLTQEDFETMRAQYEGEAVEALRRLDLVSQEADDEEELEAEIARVKARLRCPSCGAARRPGLPCPACGAS